VSETPSSLLTGSRKLRQNSNQAELKLAEVQYENQKNRLTREVKALNIQKQQTSLKSKALSAKSKEIAERGGFSSFAYGAIDLVKSPFTEGSESDLLKKEISGLGVLQQDGINMQNALVEDYSELREQKKKLDAFRRRNLGAEKAALKDEYREEKGRLKALKKSVDEDTADTMDAEVARRGYLDLQIKESQDKVDALYDARQKNLVAKRDAKAQSKQSVSSPIQKCPDQCISHDLVVACSHGGGSRKALAGAPGSKTLELQVVSAPSSLTDTGVDEISVYISGSCSKGKTTMSAASGLSGVVLRKEEGEHCPYIVIKGVEKVSDTSDTSPSDTGSTDINLPGTAGNPLSFNAYSPTVDWTAGFITKPSWVVFIKHLFFTELEDKYCTYLIEGASCDGPGSNAIAEVHAFTREKWTMEASFSWKKAEKSGLNTKQNLKSKSSTEVSPASLTKAQWSITGKATGNVGPDHFSLETAPDFLKNVFDTMNHLLYFLASADDAETEKEKDKDKDKIFTWEWIPPKITIAAARELKENPANNLVDLEYKYAIKMDPFFGIKAKLDVLQALINLAVNCAAPGAGTGAIRFVEFVQEVLLKSENKETNTNTSVSFKALIDLEMELVLAGELSCTKVYGGEPKTEFTEIDTGISNGNTQDMGDDAGDEGKNSQIKGAAEMSAVGKMLLKGLVKAEFRHSNSWFEVHASVGAGLVLGVPGGGTTEISLTVMLEIAEGGPDFKGEAKFTGLVLSFMSFATASIDKAKTDQEVQSMVENGREGEEVKKTEEKFKEELTGTDLKEIWTIFEPKNLPFWEN